LLATCCSIPGIFALLQGQIALPLLLAIIGSAWAARRGHGGWAGALLAMTLLKPQLTWLAVLAVLAVTYHRGVLRAALLSLGLTSAALLGVSLALRPRWPGEWLVALHQAAGAGGTGSRALWANMGTVPAVAAHLSAPLGAALLALAIIAGLLVLGRLTARTLAAVPGATTSPLANAEAGEAMLLAGAILVGSVVTPWMWIYDGVFWLIPVAIAIARGPGWRRWGGLAVFVALPWIVRVLHIASARAAGTSLNTLEDVLVAPALLALLLIEPRLIEPRRVAAAVARWRTPPPASTAAGASTPAAATPPATPAGRQR
jgi:hypothetical protein